MDLRIIDLDLDYPILPNFFDKYQYNNLTLCAGDGKQEIITDDGKLEAFTDIEWFTTNKIGFSRENKPTNIFMTAKNYMPELVEENKRYLIDNPHLEVLLLVYDDKSLKYRENLCLLFKDSINNIYEDNACYGKKLNLKILDCILKPNGVGIYHMYMHGDSILQFIEELYIFENYKSKFTIDLDNNKIKKNNRNIIIANERDEREDRYEFNKAFSKEFNKAINTFEERKKLDEADNLKRIEYKNRNRNTPPPPPPIEPNSIYPHPPPPPPPPPIEPNSIYPYTPPPPITPNSIYPHTPPPPITIQPIRSNSRKGGIKHNSNSNSSSRKRKNTSSKSPRNSSSGKRKKSRKSPPKTKKRFN